MNPVSEHDGAVEREAGLRTVPGDELANRVVVGSLAAGRRQAVQDGRLGVFEVRERQDALRRLLLARFRLGIGDGLLSVAGSFIECPSLRRQSGVIGPRGRPARIITPRLALTPGTRLGVYEITAQLGEGGMGQVYRATDTKLKRQVAIKILPAVLRG